MQVFPSQSKEVGESMSIISYWISLWTRFPRLAPMALRYLFVPIGSVDAERAFSSLESVLTISTS